MGDLVVQRGVQRAELFSGDTLKMRGLGVLLGIERRGSKVADQGIEFVNAGEGPRLS